MLPEIEPQQAMAAPNFQPVPAEAVTAELERILASPEFQGSAPIRNILRFVVEQTLAGGAREIKGYTIAIQVLGRQAEFDGGKDPIVRILAGRLRRALEHYYLTRGAGDPVKINIPKGTYVPTFQNNHSAGPEAEASLAKLAQALPAGPTVAVLPLLNLTADSAQEYFADGLAEELTNELARYQELRVIAFQSSRRRWQGRVLDHREVSRDLGVRFLVEGSVRRDDRKIKIAVQLIDALSGVQLWGEQYCRALQADSIISVQEEIAKKVVAQIGSEYGIIFRTLSQEARQKPPESLKTYEALLRYYQYVTVLTPQAFAATLRVLEHAVSREPECGLAWAMLANLHFHNYSLQIAHLPRNLAKARQCAQKGIALEPRNQFGRTTLAYLHFLNNDREPFLLEAQKAVVLNPHAPGLVGFLGWLLALYGEWERGLAILKTGIALNPHYPGWFHMAPFFNFYRQGRYGEALEEARQFQMPLLFWDPLLRAAALGRLGKSTEAAQALTELLALKPDFSHQARFLIGCFAKFDDLIDALLVGLQQAGLALP